MLQLLQLRLGRLHQTQQVLPVQLVQAQLHIGALPLELERRVSVAQRLQQRQQQGLLRLRSAGVRRCCGPGSRVQQGFQARHQAGDGEEGHGAQGGRPVVQLHRLRRQRQRVRRQLQPGLRPAGEDRAGAAPLAVRQLSARLGRGGRLQQLAAAAQELPYGGVGGDEAFQLVLLCHHRLLRLRQHPLLRLRQVARARLHMLDAARRPVPSLMAQLGRRASKGPRARGRDHGAC